MHIIERTNYLNQLKNVKGTHEIKVITGVRRSGKSILLKSFIDWIKNDDKEANIISIDFTSLKFEGLKEYHALNTYIEEKFNKKKNNYLFIDEVQLCPQFELTINSLHASNSYDIYVTRSNAFLLSSDLATLFTGRTYELEVFPFSFEEYMEYFKYSDKEKAFDQYILEGGMSGSYEYKTPEDKYNFIAQTFNTLIIRDIKQKYKIRNQVLMDKTTKYMLDNIANLSSARKMAETLASNKESVNHKTIGKYIEYLCNAFLFYKVSRYDIKGKKYLASSEKYYLSDHAFRYAVLGTKNMDYGHIIENIVAVELMRRGYEIYTGTLYKKEIDFVAIKRNEKIYIQVADDISGEKTFAREIDPLLKISDAYPRFLIARTRHDDYQHEGIKIVNIINWLQSK